MRKKTESVFAENKLDAVIHCCAFKAVGESVQKPIEYYTNNLMTTLSGCQNDEEISCSKYCV